MLIINANLITWGDENQILENQALRIDGGKIVAIGDTREIATRYPDEDVIDANGQFVMPGNICAHTHFYGAYARGMAIPGPAPKDFPEILEKLWWPLDRALDEDAVRASAEVMLVDAIKHGTTTLIDHHASPNAIDGSLDIIAGAVAQSGLRGVLCYEVTDRNGKEGTRAGIRENVRFIEKVIHDHNDHGRLKATFGMHASLTLSEETLEECRSAVPAGVGFHIHVAEHEADEYDSLAKSGLRVVDRLHKHGILGPRSIVAHAIHVDAKEVNLLLDSGTWVTHQPRSNMNNGVGVAQVESLMRAGVPVCLGTDGFSHTMWEEWKTAYLLHKVWHRDPRRMNGMDVLRMGVKNNAALAGLFYDVAPIGVIMEGALADLIFVDYKPHTPMTPDNVAWHIIFGFHESMITTTITDGKVLMRNRQLLTMDETEVAKRALELAPGVWSRYQAQFE